MNSASAVPPEGFTTSTSALGSTAILLPKSSWVNSSVSIRFNRLRSGFGWPDESTLLMGGEGAHHVPPRDHADGTFFPVENEQGLRDPVMQVGCCFGQR